ncbi:hypothetical protein LZ31DRAFT_94198 [Colletotrichum somersetense]|nr:hypothetical protein LZ31DRAFT_94198 [Colletotrichum somersetense]
MIAAQSAERGGYGRKRPITTRKRLTMEGCHATETLKKAAQGDCQEVQTRREVAPKTTPVLFQHLIPRVSSFVQLFLCSFGPFGNEAQSLNTTGAGLQKRLVNGAGSRSRLRRSLPPRTWCAQERRLQQKTPGPPHKANVGRVTRITRPSAHGGAHGRTSQAFASADSQS